MNSATTSFWKLSASILIKMCMLQMVWFMLGRETKLCQNKVNTIKNISNKERGRCNYLHN